jgi:hypothetical protein
MNAYCQDLVPPSWTASSRQDGKNRGIGVEQSPLLDVRRLHDGEYQCLHGYSPSTLFSPSELYLAPCHHSMAWRYLFVSHGTENRIRNLRNHDNFIKKSPIIKSSLATT